MEKNSKGCDPQDVAVKSFFLGPSSENRIWLQGQVTNILNQWFNWREKISRQDGPLITSDDTSLQEFKAQQQDTERVILEILKRFEDEIPKFSPRYIGHMFSEISMPAILGHIITLVHNPNNISSEASRVGTEIEKQAMEFLSNLVGFSGATGHFTSGGTVANFEFLFRARERLSKWLSVAIASGEKDLFSASLMGWDKFNTLKQKIENFDENEFNLFNNVFTSIKSINKQLNLEIKPPALLVSSSKHYSWPKAMHYLGLGESNTFYVALDERGRMSTADLKEKLNFLKQNNIPLLGVVGIVGTTELGTIDPISSIVEILRELKEKNGSHIWFHIDAAYGGFFRSLLQSETSHSLDAFTAQNLSAMAEADSVTLDPHKLGYVPFASGAFICKNADDYFIRSFTGPYIKSDRYNLGNFTLEGSRSATGAVATYASMKAFAGLSGYSRILSRAIQAKKDFKQELNQLGIPMFFPEGLDTNIICFSVLADKKNLSEVNELNLKLYDKIQSNDQYWISKTTLDIQYFEKMIKACCEAYSLERDTDHLLMLRLTLMNPFVISKESPVSHAREFAKMVKSFAI